VASGGVAKVPVACEPVALVVRVKVFDGLTAEFVMVIEVLNAGGVVAKVPMALAVVALVVRVNTFAGLLLVRVRAVLDAGGLVKVPLSLAYAPVAVKAVPLTVTV